MLYYPVDERSPHFPRHNGHRGWPYFPNTVEAAAVEDLFWRKVQVSPDFAWEVVRTVWPDAVLRKREVVLPSDKSISLLPESCGAYTSGSWGGLYDLRGDASDTKRINRGMEHTPKAGYFLGPLAALDKGWLGENVVSNILRALKSKMSASERVHFHEKAGHRQVLMGKELTKDEVEAIIKMAYPVNCGLTTWNIYWYKTEDGNVSHGVVDFCDSTCHSHSLVISAWQPEFRDVEKVVFDMLNIAPPYPLYNLDELVQYSSSRYALVCESESTVEHIALYHAWISYYWPITTYAAIDETDWSKLSGKTPIIFPEATQQGIRDAYRLYTALTKQGFQSCFLKRQKCSERWSAEFVQDLGQLTYKNGLCGLKEFAEHAQREFGVQPPAGVLPKAVPLSALRVPKVPREPLMDGLLDTGELLMIHAWRGVGKSLFALLLALCFASGKSALNGRVCPTRKYKVLLLDGEMPADKLISRAYALCAGHNLPLATMDNLVIRSSVVEEEKLELESDTGFTDLEPDMKAAEIIIVDSAFKFFPSSMNPEFDATKKMQERLCWARPERTIIVIDHEGKGGATSYGSMGKEIFEDSILRLQKTKKNTIQANVKKVRNHAEPSEAYLDMRIESHEKGNVLIFQVAGDHKGAAALEAESSGTACEGEPTESSAVGAKSLNEAIKQYVSEHPDAAQGVIVSALMKSGCAGRSTIQARIKALSEAGKLPGWQNRPETHKVAEQPALKGDQN